jgi:acid phosphatase type 7
MLDGASALDRAMRVLEARMRYHDGIAVWINGVPVARREQSRVGDRLASATRPHGPEWESVFVPVVPGLLRAGDNVIAIEVRPAAQSTTPALEFEMAGRPSGSIVRGPMVQRVGATTATIVIETDVPTAAEVTWGTSAADHVGATDAVARRRHELALIDLPADGVVHYRVTVDGVLGSSGQFTTTPGPGEVVRIGVYGDVRGGHRIHAALVQQLLAAAPDLVLASGDLVLRGSDEADWQQFFAVTAPLLASIPYYPAVGNHDLGRAGDLARRFTDLFALPPPPPDRPPGAGWYSFDVGDVHITALDSNAYDEAGQRAWLESDLLAADSARAIFVLVHDGPYSRGTHGGNQSAVRDYVPIMVRHRVTLLLSGHDHLYQRGRQDGLDYVVSGGGGAPLYRVRCGAAGRPRCVHPDGMLHVASEHHYLMLTVYPQFVELCATQVDGSPLESCQRLATRSQP